MDRRPRHAAATRWARRASAGALVLCGVALAPGAASAQTAPNGNAGEAPGGNLAPTLDAATPPMPGAVAPYGAGDNAEGGLKSTTAIPDGTDPTAGGATDPNGKITLRATANPTKLKSTSTAKLRQGPPPLPPLEAYARSLTLHGTRTDQTATGTLPASPPPVLGPTVAVLPAPAPLRHPRPDPDPFAPVGYDIGSLRLTPYVEQSLGYDSNPDQVATGVRPSGFSRTEGGFDLLSLWSANQLKAAMHAGYDEFFSDPGANRPDANGTVDYRLDVTRDLAFDAEGRFAVSTQRPGSPEVNAPVVDRPLVTSYGATLGGSDTQGRFTFGLHGLLDRTDYANGRLSNGATVVLDDQTYNDYALQGRVDYELLPTIKPFVQVTVDTRVHDRRLDTSGERRDSDGVVGQVGLTFEITRLLTGSIAAGYENRRYDDPRLRDLRGPVIDASLSYAVTPLTTVTFNADTSFYETDIAGSPGAESRTFSLQLSHALLRNLTVAAIAGYTNTDYVGSSIVENTYSGTLKATYNISRSLLLDASYNHTTLNSTAPASSYSQDMFMVGLRLQH